MLQTYRQKIDRKLNDYKTLVSKVRDESLEYSDAEDRLGVFEEAQKVIQQTAQIIQQEAHQRIAGVVTRCLEVVFDEPYEFRIEFEQKRGKTEANLVFVRNGLRLTDPMNQAGGGPVEIAAFALRLACLVLQRPPLRRLLVLDEPFKNVRGKHNRQRVRSLVESLSNELDVQFVLCVDVEAYPEFLLGKVVEID